MTDDGERSFYLRLRSGETRETRDRKRQREREREREECCARGCHVEKYRNETSKVALIGPHNFSRETVNSFPLCFLVASRVYIVAIESVETLSSAR